MQAPELTEDYIYNDLDPRGILCLGNLKLSLPGLLTLKFVNIFCSNFINVYDLFFKSNELSKIGH